MDIGKDGQGTSTGQTGGRPKIDHVDGFTVGMRRVNSGTVEPFLGCNGQGWTAYVCSDQGLGAKEEHQKKEQGRLGHEQRAFRWAVLCIGARRTEAVWLGGRKFNVRRNGHAGEMGIIWLLTDTGIIYIVNRP